MTCSVGNCPETRLMNGVCRRHYMAAWRKANPEKIKGYDAKSYRIDPEKKKLRSRKWHKDNPDAARANALKFSFGITVEKYNEMFNAQEGRCAICGRHQTEFKKRLAVDHCHKTEKVRGLLCHGCNLGIGYLFDSEEILKAAFEYLHSFNSGV